MYIYIYILKKKEEEIFTAYLTLKNREPEEGKKNNKRREEHQSDRVHKAVCAGRVTAVALTFVAAVSAGPWPCAWPRRP